MLVLRAGVMVTLLFVAVREGHCLVNKEGPAGCTFGLYAIAYGRGRPKDPPETESLGAFGSFRLSFSGLLFLLISIHSFLVAEVT